MRILQLCHKPPFPPVDGTAIAMSNLTRGLIKNGAQIDLLAMNTYKQYCIKENQELFEKEVGSYTLVDIDIRIKAIDAFKNLFTKESYNISRFVSDDFQKRLITYLEENQYDVVLFDSLFTAPYVDLVKSKHSGLIVHRSHNVEFCIWENLAKNEKNLLRKTYLNFLSRRLKKFELSVLTSFDLIATISEADHNTYKRNGVKTNLYHLPFGINLSDYTVSKPTGNQRLKLYHVGSMNWIPHQEAFRWFFDFVWSRLSHLEDSLELHLAGTAMPNWIKEKASANVFISDGYVEGNEFSKDKDLLIVPSFSGSGIRIKIIEAMAAGKPIITTDNGAMGITYNSGENILICDSYKEWIYSITELVKLPQKRESIGLNARQFCSDNHDFIKIANQFIVKLNSVKESRFLNSSTRDVKRI